MTQSTQRQFRINGVVDTNRTTWSNAEDIAAAAASWLSWDYFRVQVGVNINKPALPVKHFTDSNILGSINVTETPLESLYNRVEIIFPHVDLTDRTDSVQFEIPDNEKLTREIDNTLRIRTDLFNNPVQAEQIALTELRQARMNKVITFTSDFTAINVTANDIIEVSNDYFGWNKKQFRVVSVDETDLDDGSFVFTFIAVEYSESIYDYDNLRRALRSRKTGIPGAFVNTSVQTANSVSVARSVGSAAQTDEGRAALSEGGIPTVQLIKNGWSPAEVAAGVNAQGSFFGTEIEASQEIKSAQLIFSGPVGFFTYISDGVQKTVASGIPLNVSFETQKPGQSYVLREGRTLEWSTYTAVAVLTDIEPGERIRVIASPVNTLDLSANDPVMTYVSGTGIVANPGSGDAASLVITTFT